MVTRLDNVLLAHRKYLVKGRRQNLHEKPADGETPRTNNLYVAYDSALANFDSLWPCIAGMEDKQESPSVDQID
ncbi:MAG: hypothetical protein QF486_02755 [Candidatus Woesearchaeota archaeon]|jgi:hypothetical protein|nr:hypothetical protein [Candidatus Woesearchaeota archaeon]MDP7181474.1 hypothetical protein [Candidatus Woesearchaeota archaeon]MDP7198516.1 hypothetical protein [Candidatus Woesearchaeota archaeon]MDP7466742.1 hypothetical protein [Candidatus Woesearchaeota archaeon]MDP7647967.1 hypothetical protein [Candidatus Woesearchaeota archaeon]